MDQVLVHAGVSRATLYSNFSDKTDLLAAVIAAGAESFLTGVSRQQVTNESIERILIRFGDQLLAFISEAETMAFERLVAQAALSAPEHGPRFFAAGPGLARTTLVGIIQAAQAQGELQQGDAEQAAHDLMGLWQGMWRLEVQYGARPAVERAELDELVRHGVRQFLRLYVPH